MHTSVNRDPEANRIVSRINGVQNALFPQEGELPRTIPVPAALFAPVSQLIAEMTQEASERGDETWLSDMESVLRCVVPIYARDPKEVLDMLLFALRSSWRQAEAMSGRGKTVSQGIGTITGKVRDALGNFEQWLKKQMGQ